MENYDQRSNGNSTRRRRNLTQILLFVCRWNSETIDKENKNLKAINKT
jgi:hypothetical protein